MRKNRFSLGSGCYSCRSCSKKTRNVEDNGSCQLCPLCYERTTYENPLSDNGWGEHGDLDHCTSVADVHREFEKLKAAAEDSHR